MNERMSECTRTQFNEVEEVCFQSLSMQPTVTLNARGFEEFFRHFQLFLPFDRAAFQIEGLEYKLVPSTIYQFLGGGGEKNGPEMFFLIAGEK